jgi:uncharacterized protein YndB with AHSA1/START domain
VSDASIDPENVPVIEVTIAAPIAEVWRALRDRKLLRTWHGWDYETPDGTDGLDAEIQVIYFGDDVVETPSVRLFLGTDTFDLTETDQGVRLRLTRSAKGGNPEWDAYYDDITEGWTTFLHQLKWAVEQHPGQGRITHFSVGTPHRPGSIVDRLGLAGIAGQAPGTPYAITLPMSIDITGTVFFRTPNQLGLTVTDWGNGLLIVADAGTAAHRPVAGSSAILSTYGLPADDLAKLRETWDAWWTSQFESVTLPGESPATP